MCIRDRVLAGPDIVSRGFVYVRGAESLMEDAKHLLEDKMQYCMDKGITDWGKIKNEIKDSLGDFVWKETKRRPMICLLYTSRLFRSALRVSSFFWGYESKGVWG